MTTVKIQSVPYGSRGETTKTLKELLKTSVPEIRKAISNGRAMEYNYKTLTELQVIHEYREKPTRMFQENIYGLASLTLTQINKIKTLNLIIIGSKGMKGISRAIRIVFQPCNSKKSSYVWIVLCGIKASLINVP